MNRRTRIPVDMMEAGGTAVLLLSASLLTHFSFLALPVWIEWPAIDPVWLRQLLPRAVVGIGMGATLVGLIYSPWGRISGAHYNPALTLSFYFLGKIDGAVALRYVFAQSVGAVTGVGFARLLLGDSFAMPPVEYIVTIPPAGGEVAAFILETSMAFLLMLMVLATANSRRWATATGWLAGLMVALFIIVEAPYSGMSINPARSLGSALLSGRWDAFWVYLSAPTAGMVIAAIVYSAGTRARSVRCAKLIHDNTSYCPFRCGYSQPILSESSTSEVGSHVSNL